LLGFYNSRLPIARKIKEIYEQKGLSQSEIAKHLGCEAEAVELIEKEREIYSKEQIEKLAEFLEITEISLDINERESYQRGLSAWRVSISKQRFNDAIRVHDELYGLYEIEYLPFDNDLIMLYRMYKVKHLLTEGNYDGAEEILKRAESNIKKEYLRIQYHYHYNMGLLYSLRKGYKEALRSYKTACNIGFSDEDQYKLHYNMGICYSHLGMYLRAVICYEKAELLSKHDQMDFFSLHIGNNLALDYLKLGETNLAKKKLADCVECAEFHEDREFSGQIMLNLGRICIKEKGYARALEYFEVAKKFMDETSAIHFEILYYTILCLITSRDQSAENELTRAKLIFQENKHYSLLFDSLSHILTLENKTSVEYIENTTIPNLIGKCEYFRAADYYSLLEIHFKTSGEEAEALKIKASLSELYKKMIGGGEEYEEEISWPYFTSSYSGEC